VISPEGVPVLFGAIVIIVMALVPLGSAQVLRLAIGLPNRIRSSHDPTTPHSLEAR